jgi:hypothetical protein
MIHRRGSQWWLSGENATFDRIALITACGRIFADPNSEATDCYPLFRALLRYNERRSGRPLSGKRHGSRKDDHGRKSAGARGNRDGSFGVSNCNKPTFVVGGR